MKLPIGGDMVLAKHEGELDVTDVSKEFGVDTRTVRYWVERGNLKPDRTIRTSEKRTYHFFNRATVDAYRSFRENKPASGPEVQPAPGPCQPSKD